MRIFDLGKFSKIIFALGLFLVCVAGVLAYNFQVSSRFSRDAVAIKYLAQQQRQPAAIIGFSQALTQSLKTGSAVDETLEELRDASRGFDDVFGRLATVGTVQDSDGSSARVVVPGRWARR